ncbi:DNA polymerase III subunit beta [Paenibacillus sp. NPDC056579]|uniref:DNA polymerase III subunit beta n=1 Tax=Paenibacillus sp. NPDC056579 TaxID=3345871 RepID=UPI003673DD6B
MSALLEYQQDEGSMETTVNATKQMSFHVEHDVIMNALTLCAKIVPRSGAVPILGNIKFDLMGHTLFITAMDASQSTLQMVKVKNESNLNGSYLFPAKEGIELVKRLPHGNLTFTKEDSTVFITYGKRGKASITVLKAEEYPQLPKLEQTEILNIPIEVLRKGAMASRFASADETTPSITGIHIYNQNGKLAFIATDRHRAYRFISEISIENQETFENAIIPALSFKQIVDSLKTDQVECFVTSSYLVLKDKNIVYFGRLIDAIYPDLSHIYAGVEEGTFVTLLRSELDETLNRALSLDAENNRVTLEVNEQGTFVLHTRSQTSELCEEFSNVKVGPGFPTMKFNGRYLRDALLVGDREVQYVTLKVSGNMKSGFMKMDKDPTVVVIVNPVK